MPTNEQRRETAKAKLEQQLEQRAKQARQRRVLAIAGAAVTVLIVVAAVVVTLVITHRDSKNTTAQAMAGTATSETSPEGEPGQLPAFTPGVNVGANCQYPLSPEAASKPAKPPKSGKVPTDPAKISVSLTTDQGNVGLQLDNAKAPCTVNSFASLAQQGYFDNTQCHRLTTSPMLSVLQCGDPVGNGTGGPGYQFANEYPTDQYPEGDPASREPVNYPRGTLAMANAGPGTNGSQFFLVYKNSQLPPQYTVFGTIDETGLATLDNIAKNGVAGGSEDGAPTKSVTIKSVRLD